jgi:hypothetical protein
VNVLFVNDSTTHANWGGRAASIALRMMIRQSGGTIVRTITIDDLESPSLGASGLPDAAGDGRGRAKEALRPFVPPVLLRLRRRFAPPTAPESRLIPGTWEDYGPAMQRVLNGEPPWPHLLASCEDVDVAVVFGDGDIYGNHLLPRALLFLSYVLKRHLGKSVVMVAHSADFAHPDLLRVAEHVYPLYDDVVFRDRVSAERCRSLCRGRVAADTAFWFEPAAREAWTPVAGRPTYFDVWPAETGFDPARPYLCLGGSSLNHDADADTVFDGYAGLVEHLRSIYAGQVVLTVSDTVDDLVFRALAEAYDLPVIGVTTPVQQAVDVLGNADAYIGGRYHPSIFALRGGTPIVPLAGKTFKMQALADMAGLPSATFDAGDPARDKDVLGRQLLAYLDQGDQLRNKLRAWAGDMARDSWQNVAYLARLRALEGTGARVSE